LVSYRSTIAPGATSPRCTTRLKNAHGTVFRELLYPWHPWFGMKVAVHEAIAKADGVVFRCTLSGLGTDRWLEVPAWMFERAACPDRARLATAPFVGMDALSALADLLRQALKDWPASSTAPLAGVSGSSRNPIRGEAHDSSDIGASVSPISRTPKAGLQQSARRISADGPVRQSVANIPDEGARMAGSAGRDAGGADHPDGAIDPGTRKGRRDRRRDRGRS